VAERFREVAERTHAPAFVRISGDSPLIDPAIIDQGVAYFELHDCDLATNVLVRSFPKGQSVEVLRAATFARVCESLSTAAQKEHVTQAFYEHPTQFRIVGFTSGADAGSFNLSVDTPDDLARANQLLTAASGATEGWRELLARYRALGC
jgi:spore coat polysaccharide biosynthesis protein SpsF